MTRTVTPLTPNQVKERLRQRGQTTTQWAAEHGFSRRDVYRVLNGQLKAHYGKAHEIAVLLGLKVSESPKEPTTAAPARNAQQRKVA